MAAEWKRAGQARTDIADMVEGLSEEQLAMETLCAGWTAREVLAHQLVFADLPLPKFMLFVAKAGFNFDKASINMVNSYADKSISEMASTLRAKATKSSPMPTFKEDLTLSDCAIHTQDIRRPLGLPGALSEDVVRSTLDFLTKEKQGSLLADVKPFKSVRLEATDMDWSHGSGPTLSGPAEALMMTVGGRHSILDELTGDAVEILRRQL